MSTTTLTTPTTPTAATSVAGGVIASTRAELLRLRKWPAVWITIGAWMAMTAMFGYLFNYLSYTTGDSSFSNEGESTERLLTEILPANVPHVLLQGMPMFGGALMLVLGALVAGNGYGWGTWKTVFTQGPARSSVVAGSLAALTAFVVATVLATLALCLGLALLVAATESRHLVWPGVGDLGVSLGAGFLVMEMLALIGFLLGTLARGPALSVGLGLVWTLVVENLLRGVGELLGPVEAFTKILPGTVAAHWSVRSSAPAAPTRRPGCSTPSAADRRPRLLIGYLVLTPLLAAWLVNRRDVA